MDDSGVLNDLITFAVGGTLCFIFSIGFTLRFRSYRDGEHSKISTFAVIFSMFFTLLSACLVTFDVFLVSSMKNYDGHFRPWAKDPAVRNDVEWKVQQAYYAVYGIILVFAFLILPFSYFLHSLRGEDEEPETNSTKLCRALKYTLASVVFFGLLVVIGILLPFDGLPPSDEPRVQKLQFIIQSFKSSHGDNLIVFLMNIMNIVGVILITIYVAYGMTSLPLGLIYEGRTVASARAAVEDQLANLDAQVATIRNQFEESGTQIPYFEAQQIERLEKEARLLRRSHFDLDQRSRTFVNRCASCWRPFQVLLGVFFALFGFLIFITLLLVSVDKAMHSLGPSSGYALPNATLPNPFDIILVYAQELFPLDYILYSWIIVFLIMCSISGVKNLGIRFLWLTVYKIRSYSTKPQALILMSLNLIFITMAVSVIIFAMIPDYTTYGSQNYFVNISTDDSFSTIPKRCSGIDAPPRDCIMTRMAMLLLVFHSKAWIFGAAFFWLTWMFLLMVVIMSVWCFMRFRREKAMQESDDREELLDDAEPLASNEA